MITCLAVCAANLPNSPISSTDLMSSPSVASLFVFLTSLTLSLLLKVIIDSSKGIFAI